MPAYYAHYRFGKEVSSKLTNVQLKEVISKYYPQFAMGLQGPDPFFFYKPYKSSAVKKYGNDLHDQIARPFFERGKTIVQQYGCDSKQYAYLLGFLCHYMLDSECHPYVEEMVRVNKVDHIEIEEEFEKKLLRLDKEDPFAFSLADLVYTDENTVEAMAPFFKERTKKEIQNSLHDLKMLKKLFWTPHALKYTCVNTILKCTGKYASFKGLMHQKKDNPKCFESNEGLMRRYAKAIPMTVEMLQHFDDYVLHDMILSDRMNRTFG